MKNTYLKQNSALKSRAEQASTGRNGGLPKLDYALRRANRQLSTGQLLQLLQTEAPDFFNLAQVVGQWVWIQFAGKQPRTVTSTLSQLGFHWNRTRQAWQHPCGVFQWQPGDCDPRERFGIRPAANLKAA